jgi:N-acyl-D-aspartate/D-glutamate deacylase
LQKGIILLSQLEERTMHDIVIRGGTIIDGTGKPAFTGDLAIAGERLVEVGGKLGPARREIDASGLLVTPGWVDVHTHYDGQAIWDPLLGPSCWHGVTTAMFGNCGVGFAPVKPQHRAALMELMEGVEEIPGVVLTDGLTWEWETFPDFLDALERRRARSTSPPRSRITRCASMSWAIAPFASRRHGRGHRRNAPAYD